MDYIFEGKSVNIPDEYIEKNVKNLDISVSQAIAMYLSDEGLVEAEGVAEMTAKAKKFKTGAKATGEPRKRKPPVRKPDEIKRALIEAFSKSMDTDIEQIGAELSIGSTPTNVTNIERMIAFTLGDEKYEVTLTKKRKPKEL